MPRNKVSRPESFSFNRRECILNSCEANKNEYDFARRKFELGPGGEVYRKAEPMKRAHGQDRSGAVGTYNPRFLVCVDDAVEKILEVHDECGHNGLNKTWEVFEERYYGIIRDDVSILC